MAQRPAVLCQIRAASGLADGRGIEQAEYEVMESPTGIKDALKIVGELAAVGSRRVVHQYLGIAHHSDCGRAQFLPHVGNERALRPPIDFKVKQFSRGTSLLF
jgi:hypothetical protein